MWYIILFMASPILLTKLFVPAMRLDYVARPRLIEKLNQSSNSRLTLISAPAGFGKTTLVTEWLQSFGEGVGVAWVSLDENDNDPAQFLTYLIEALRLHGLLLQ